MSDTLPGLAVPDASATISDDGVYRYDLTRTWDAASGRLTFVMLNPSTADAAVDDPTIRRCKAFAKREGFGGIVVLNLYALRATNPRELDIADDPVGPGNDDTIARVLASKTRAVAAWGAHAAPARARAVTALAPHVAWQALSTTKAGAPRHPLYVRGDTPLEAYCSDAPDRLLILGDMGGFVCAECGDPVESEPCREHQPVAWAACNA